MRSPVAGLWNPESVAQEAICCSALQAGVRSHPLYQGVPLEHIARLNAKFRVPFDFCEYLAIHAMFSRLLGALPGASGRRSLVSTDR